MSTASGTVRLAQDRRRRTYMKGQFDMKRHITTAINFSATAVLATCLLSGCTSAEAKATPTVAVLVSPGAGETYSPDFKQVVEYTSDAGGHLLLASTDAGHTRSVFDESLAGD